MFFKRLLAVVLCTVLGLQCTVISFAEETATVTIGDKVIGKTPKYVGFNPGGNGQYEDGSIYGDPSEYGTHAYWFKQAGINMMRAWGTALGDEGMMGSYKNSNDTLPDGDRVSSEKDFEKAKREVLNRPEKNKYINLDKFDRAKMLPMKELQDMGIENVVVLRHKHIAPYVFPDYMGATMENNYDASLDKWEYKWEWWEYCFAMSYLYAKNAGITFFEFGNEPEWQQQGGLTPKQQVNAIKIGSDAVKEGVRAATKGRGEAFIMGCGTSMNTSYLEPYGTNDSGKGNYTYVEAIMKDAPEKVDAISIHAYDSDKNAMLQDALTQSKTKPVYISEAGANANSNAQSSRYNATNTLFDWFRTGNERFEGVLLFKVAGGGNNEITNQRSDKNGLYQPRDGYYGIRMMYRAAVNKKDVYEASSQDVDITPLVTRDSKKTFITMRNSNTTSAKTYTVALPYWAKGSIQHVQLLDTSAYLDDSWTGVSINGSTLTITAQPKQSFLQIVIGDEPLNPLPDRFDETRFRLNSLSDKYIAASVGTIRETYTDSFTNCKDIELVNTNRWIPRGTKNQQIDGSIRGLKYFDRLYLSSNGETAEISQARMLWNRDQVRMTDKKPVVYESDIGFDEPDRYTHLGILYRDNNGNMIGIKAVPGEKGSYEIIKAENAYTAEAFFLAKADGVSKLWASDIPVLNEGSRIKLTITPDIVQAQILNTKGKIAYSSCSVKHGLNLSGVGRIGLGKSGNQPVWIDNLMISGANGWIKPPAATVIESVYGKDQGVLLNWTKLNDAVGYTIKYGTISGIYTNTLDVGNVTSYKVTGLTNGTKYFFTVTAQNNAGVGSSSNEVNAVPVPAEGKAAAPPVKSLFAQRSSYTWNLDYEPKVRNTTVVNWSLVDNAVSYNVKYGTQPGSYTATRNVPGNQNSTVISGLNWGTRYYFVLTSLNSAGESVVSKEMSVDVPLPEVPAFIASARTPDSGGRPAARINSQNIEDTTVRVAWSEAVSDSPIDHYKLFLNSGAPVATVSAEVYTYEFKNLTPWINYRVFVVPVNQRGEWGMFLTGSFEARDTTPPVWPEDSKLEASGTGTDSVKLTWTPAEDIFGIYQYKIYMNGTLLAAVNGDIFTYDVKGLMPETQYTFKVEAGDAAIDYRAQRYPHPVQVPNWTTNGPSVAITNLK